MTIRQENQEFEPGCSEEARSAYNDEAPCPCEPAPSVIDEEELRLLQDISRSAELSADGIRGTLSGRINSFILIVSFVVLGEAAVLSALLSVILSDDMDLALRVVFLVLLLVTVGLLAWASIETYQLFKVNLAIVLSPEELELPYLKEDLYKKNTRDLSDEEKSLFIKPLRGQGALYEDVNLIYRRWVFQKAKALSRQLKKAEEAKKIFNKASKLILGSVVPLAIIVILLFFV